MQIKALRFAEKQDRNSFTWKMNGYTSDQLYQYCRRKMEGLLFAKKKNYDIWELS